MTTSYCTLTQVKTRLGISDTNDDTFLNDAILQASGWIENRTGRAFASETATKIFDGINAIERGRCFRMPRGIQSISLLQLGQYTGAELQTIPSTDYFLQPSPYLDPGWPYTELWMTDIPSSGNPCPQFMYGFQNIAVTGVFGWASTPYEITDIALTMVVSMYRSRSAAGGEVFTIGTDGERTIERALTIEQWKTLRRYTFNDVPII